MAVQETPKLGADAWPLGLHMEEAVEREQGERDEGERERDGGGVRRERERDRKMGWVAPPQPTVRAATPQGWRRGGLLFSLPTLLSLPLSPSLSLSLSLTHTHTHTTHHWT